MALCRAASRDLVLHSAGFSLVEALIASGLLATAIAGLMQVFVLAARSTAHARDTSYATALAAQKMEELRIRPFPDDPRSDGDDRIGAYTRRWRIAPLPAHPLDAMIITVVVSPVARQGAQEAVAIATVRMRQDR